MLADPIVKDVGEEEEPDRPADLKYQEMVMLTPLYKLLLPLRSSLILLQENITKDDWYINADTD